MAGSKLIVHVRLEQFAADFISTAAVLLIEVEQADQVLIPDEVRDAAVRMRAAMDKWRAGE